MGKYFAGFTYLGDLPKTYNQLGRKHWYLKLQESKKWLQIVAKEFERFNELPENPLPRAKVTLIRMGTRSLDPDNLAQSFKHVLDGLVKLGVLENDKWENIGMPTYEFVKVKKKDIGIRVVVEEI